MAVMKPDQSVYSASWRPTETTEKAAKKKKFSRWINLSTYKHLRDVNDSFQIYQYSIFVDNKIVFYFQSLRVSSPQEGLSSSVIAQIQNPDHHVEYLLHFYFSLRRQNTLSVNHITLTNRFSTSLVLYLMYSLWQYIYTGTSIEQFHSSRFKMH